MSEFEGLIQCEERLGFQTSVFSGELFLGCLAIPVCPGLKESQKGVGDATGWCQRKNENMKIEAQRGEMTCPRAHSSRKSQNLNPGNF